MDSKAAAENAQAVTCPGEEFKSNPSGGFRRRNPIPNPRYHSPPTLNQPFA